MYTIYTNIIDSNQSKELQMTDKILKVQKFLRKMLLQNKVKYDYDKEVERCRLKWNRN